MVRVSDVTPISYCEEWGRTFSVDKILFTSLIVFPRVCPSFIFEHSKLTCSSIIYNGFNNQQVRTFEMLLKQLRDLMYLRCNLRYFISIVNQSTKRNRKLS